MQNPLIAETLPRYSSLTMSNRTWISQASTYSKFADTSGEEQIIYIKGIQPAKPRLRETLMLKPGFFNK